MPKILIVEDEYKYAYILEKYFLNEGFEVKVALDGMAGLNAFSSFKPDIICLDIMLPSLNGYEVAERIRKVSDCPIILMSALSEEADILKGYELKIDDYVTKPFRTKILIAKVKALLERRKALLEKNNIEEKDEFILGDIRMTKELSQCFIKDENIKLTKTEFNCLLYLLEHFNENVPRNILFNKFWTAKDVDERIVDSYIKKLRKIVDKANFSIVTVFGIGYRLEDKQGKEN